MNSLFASYLPVRQAGFVFFLLHSCSVQKTHPGQISIIFRFNPKGLNELFKKLG